MKLKQDFTYMYNGCHPTTFPEGHEFTDKNDAAYISAVYHNLIEKQPKTKSTKTTETKTIKTKSTKT